VAPQLSARLTGETYTVRVAPVDPIDPFRGAYVRLDYPDLRTSGSEDWANGDDGLSGDGTVFVVLEERDGVMVGTDWRRRRPDDGVYLACSDHGWELRCGIESWFVPQDEAREIEEVLQESGALAELRVDSRGHAAVVGLTAH